MATFTNLIKNSVSSVGNIAKHAVTSVSNTVKRLLAYLLCEDGTRLLLEDGGNILIDRGVEYTNITKN